MHIGEGNRKARLSGWQIVFIAIFVVPIGVVAWATGWFAYLEHRDASANAHFFSTRPLIASLPEGNAQAAEVMRERILAQTAIGQETALLRKYLLSQGFFIREIDPSKKSYVAALSRPGNLAYLGHRGWRVRWEEDADGRLIELETFQDVTMS
ncbi:MAG: hypothetical protein JOZ84_12615 [Methylobacteriaceae bacterium]|nr:hypothetical protein [Methylobacteriaceae bacterium]